MALSDALEALIKTLPADVQAQQRGILEKHPTLGEGWLRQEDYNRLANETKAKKEEADKNLDWYKKNKPIYDQTMKDFTDAQEKATRLEADNQRLAAEVATKAAEAAAAAAAAGGGTPDADKIAAAVMSKMAGTVPTKAEIGALVAAETEKAAKAAQEQFYKETVPAAMAFQTGMNEAQWRYRDETGKSMNRAEFAKFMTDNKINDPIEAYEKYTEKDRRERDINVEVEKRDKERKEKFQKENAGFVPGSTGAQGTGHLQIRISEKKAGDPLFGQDIELGDNAAAMAAAAEIRAEGKV